jgi:tight adherence protein C
LNSQIANSKDRGSVQNRLREIGKDSPESFFEFRSKQLGNSVLVGAAITLLLILAGKSPLSAFLLGCLAAISTFVYVDRTLSKKVNQHKLQVESEFPAIIEMYSLAISAGETPLAAMERIGRTATGSMAIEFNKVVALVKNGKPFHVALDAMGRDLDSIAIRRFVDSLIIATLRGAPLIDVLQRHAQEARELQRNRVLGAAAKAEISMMVPVVFLILPISILFALWPSLANLNLFSSA